MFESFDPEERVMDFAESRLVSALEKAPSGIDGLDEVTGGGLPRSRTTLVCGGAGCGKTLMGLQFLVRGALDYGEPGVLMAFEETTAALTQNVASLGWDLDDLIARELLVIDRVSVSPGEIVESGEWDLDGLMLRIGAAIDAIGAKRVVLDTIEVLFGALSNERLLRSELRRLFGWLNERGVSVIVTGESGGGKSFTRYGLEEYVSDCVIVLDQRLIEQIATRRMRIAKYRGSAHGTDEYPVLIDDRGFSVLPITSMGLEYSVFTDRVSLGVPGLDEMLSGGAYRGTSVLLSGNPGSGKTTVGASFVAAACERGERALLFTFEESADQIVRNMASVGLDLARWREQGLLRIVASRSAAYGLERHLAEIHREVTAFDAHIVVIDPASALTGQAYEIASMLGRLVDHLKSRGATAMLTALTHGTSGDMTDLGVVGGIDTWIDLSNHEQLGERNRGISITKSRGMAHSSQLREFRLTTDGIEVRSAYASGGALLMGTARQAQEATDERARLDRGATRDAAQRVTQRRRATIEAQIAELRDSLESDSAESAFEDEASVASDRRRTTDDAALVTARTGTSDRVSANGGGKRDR
ncbi:MAG: circadian clock protein KaiC [Solirubrobacteraceae bacterium]